MFWMVYGISGCIRAHSGKTLIVLYLLKNVKRDEKDVKNGISGTLFAAKSM